MRIQMYAGRSIENWQIYDSTESRGGLIRAVVHEAEFYWLSHTVVYSIASFSSQDYVMA